MRLALRNALIAFVVALLGTPSLWAHPKAGSPAPPLNSISLLQAPPGAQVDWASLKGKVVVLEFWATWCSPCVASLPHLNQLVDSLDPTKFQFISIDDEDVNAIQTFLTRKKTLGWVGVDNFGAVFASYGINSRPTTIIVDANGKIIAITEIDSVTAADLRAVAQGKAVSFKPASEIIKTTGSAGPNADHTLFSVSLTKASPDAKMSTVEHPPTGTDFLGNDADTLMTNTFNPFDDRYVLKDALPDGRYDLRINSGTAPQTVITPLIQQAVLAGLHLRIQSKTLTRRAYILRGTDASKKLLNPSASTHAVKRGYWHGMFLLMNGSMDDLAYILATGLETPVINETGIDGTYDARFNVAGGDVDSLNTVLKTTLGLELVPGDQELPITLFEVSKDNQNRPSPTAKSQEIKH